MRRPLLFLTIVTASTQAAYSALRVLVVYQAIHLEASVLMLGVVAATYSLTPALVAMHLGRVVDRGRPTQLFATGVWLTVVAGVGVAESRHLWVLALSNVLLGFAQMATAVAGQGYVSRASDPHDLDNNFSTWSMSASIGQTIGLPLAGVIGTFAVDPGLTSVRYPALALTGLVLLTTPLMRSIPKLPARAPMTPTPQPATVRVMLGVTGMKPAIFSSMIVLACMDLLAVYLPVLAVERGLSLFVVTMLLTTRTVTSLLARAIMPLLLRRLPRRGLLVGSTLCSGVPLALVPFFESPYLTGLALAVVGIFWGVGQPLTMTWVTSLVHSSNHGAALALRMMANRVGQVAIPLVSGLFAGWLGVASVFIASGSLLIAAGDATRRATKTPES